MIYIFILGIFANESEFTNKFFTGILIIISLACIVYFITLSVSEHLRNDLYFCACCEHYVREYQIDFLRESVCPYCKSDNKKMKRIPYGEEMDWMKEYPDFKLRTFKECVSLVVKFEFQIKRNIKKIRKQAQTVAETKSFMEYTKMDEKMTDVQKQVLEDTKQLEGELIEKVEKLVEIVPLYAVGRLVKILDVLETSRG